MCSHSNPHGMSTASWLSKHGLVVSLDLSVMSGLPGGAFDPMLNYIWAGVACFFVFIIFASLMT